MTPIKIVTKHNPIDFKQTVWWCCNCGFTKPRFENDRVVEKFGAGIKCSCGTPMIVGNGATIQREIVAPFEE